MTKLALITAPVVALYSPTVPNCRVRDEQVVARHRATGLLQPRMRLALIAAPVVALYSPTVPPPDVRHEEGVARHQIAVGWFTPV